MHNSSLCQSDENVVQYNPYVIAIQKKSSAFTIRNDENPQLLHSINGYSSDPQDAPNDLSNRTMYNIEDRFTHRPFNSRDCLLPEQPEGGHYELSGCLEFVEPCNKHPNALVPEISVLNYFCKNNYVLNGSNILVCVNQEWIPKPPSCLKICPALKSTSVDISCNYQGETVSCTKNVLPGTKAVLSCKPSYTLSFTNDPAYREVTCLDDGLWDNHVFRCLPECGTSIAHGHSLIVNGLDAKVGVFPWHVGIYFKNTNEYEQICGGTLISSNLVISAAHCFYDEVFMRVNDASNYAVAAGKYFRDWDAKEDYVQKSEVESIQTGDRYLGRNGNFADDIALLKLQSPFQLTTLVKPVCMDWNNRYEREQLQEGQFGKVVGWGKDINGISTNNLQEINMPFIPYHQCLSRAPVSFRGLITHDKFCAGYLNGSSVCDGDSGSGLCFEKNGVWYLRGVVSVSPEKDGMCDYNLYVGFTYVSKFREWIRKIYVNV
ncbi:modular serine protease-like isoform X2 [Anoplolepis gracilipes]|uniref:modular serine protease-like isoform X2 n=1 Tax=Anoplolepis gracilipes TaxID=354296 RepID=UPI003B9F9BFB